ncbi:hypothetical protein NQZ68_006067 [Dissostichus eleginoides]|nr:hypothetical protein NQZ68_006067 [Dissostichus eleginoides]
MSAACCLSRGGGGGQIGGADVVRVERAAGGTFIHHEAVQCNPGAKSLNNRLVPFGVKPETDLKNKYPAPKQSSCPDGGSVERSGCVHNTEQPGNKQPLTVTLPTKVETPPRVHSCEDVKPRPLPHKLRPGQRATIARQH